MSSATKSELQETRDGVEIELTQFMREQSSYLLSISPELHPVSSALSSFLLDSGKRLRPLFAYAGIKSAGGSLTPATTKAISSLELLQACALIHDDLMDGSDTRRGKPSIHRHFESIHVQDELEGFAPAYGLASAVLLGDLALVWSNQLLNTSGISTDELRRVMPIFDEMRVELMAGQFLDIHEQTQKNTDLARSVKIARYKSGKYTIERPLHMGAVLAGMHHRHCSPRSLNTDYLLVKLSNSAMTYSASLAIHLLPENLPVMTCVKESAQPLSQWLMPRAPIP